MAFMNTTLLSKFRNKMYATLLYPHHIVSKNMRLIEFKEDKDGYPIDPVQGYLAYKNEKLYVLSQAVKDHLPIRITADDMPMAVTKYGDVVHIVPNDGYRSFKIIPERAMSWSELLRSFDQKHETQEAYTLMWGNIVHTAIASRINVCFASNVSYGKTFYMACCDSIYDNIPVIDQPRTAPAIAPGISTDGVLYVDELSGLTKIEDRVAVEGVLGGLADFSDSVSFGTGGSKQYKTMNPPPTTNLSCIITYNLFGTPADVAADKASYCDVRRYFDWMFPNSARLKDRFLRLKADEGKINVSQFNKDIQVFDDVIEHKLKMMAKTMAYFRQVKHYGFTESVCGAAPEMTQDEYAYVEKTIESQDEIKGRHMKSFREIAMFYFLAVDKDKEKFVKGINKYVSWKKAYDDMVRIGDEQMEVKKKDNITKQVIL